MDATEKLSSVAVTDSGTASVETRKIEHPDGTISHRQVIVHDLDIDISQIRQIAEQFFALWVAERPIITPSGRSLRMDDQANLLISQGVSPNKTGADIFKTISTATTNVKVIKRSPGQIYGWYIYNNNAATRSVKLYNKSKDPNVGGDIPTITLPIPGGGAANLWAGSGIGNFTDGIAIAMTANQADSDNTAVAIDDLVVNLWYN